MSKTLAIEPARWQPGEHGEVFAPQYGDVYASRSGAWGQAQAVFIEGCDLSARLAAHSRLRLLETGFGLGVNFLSTWARCRDSGQPYRLHYVSIEKHPFTREDLRAALHLSIAAAPAGLQPALQSLAERLLAAWPPLIPGFHTLLLDEQTTLTLVFGDIEQVLPALRGPFDAFYLDGFAPDRNPSMWSQATLSRIAALAAPGARVASWCVAGAVRRALAAAGFEVGKRPGFGSKRDSLVARWTRESAADTRAVPTAVVVGAGIAGASIARQLASRGVAVTVIDKDLPASGASGNPVAVVRPEPGGAGNPIAEFSAAGVIWLRQWLALHGSSVPHAFCGALRITRDRRRHDKLAAYAQTVPDDWLREVDVPQAQALCGQAIADAAFLLPQAGWVQASALVAAMLAHPLITLRTEREAGQLSPVDGGWQLSLSDGSQISAPFVVLATAFGALSPVALALDRARGQLSSLPQRPGQDLRTIVCRDGYITPSVNGLHTIGATIQYDDEDRSARVADDAENFERLERLLPGFAQTAQDLRSGRVSWRSTTQDRLPLVGQLADGLYASLGHGSRGIACGPLCAEFLAALMLNEPLPLGAEWIARLDPRRFRS